MKHERYRFFTEPSAFSEEFLIVSDGMGTEDSNTLIIDRKNFNNNIVMIVLSGELHVEQNDKQLILRAGEGVLTNLMAKHKYYVPKGCNVNFIWLHFRGTPCISIMKKLASDNKLPFQFQDINMWKKIYKCFQIVRNGKYEYTLSGMIYDVILDISKIAYLSDENSNDFISIVNSYIEKNIFNDINLEDLSQKLHLSKYYFCRLFKKHTGMSPMNYVNIKKIEAAKKMLIMSNDKIESISNELNFTDRSHFSKTFKKYTGKTPVEFRN